MDMILQEEDFEDDEESERAEMLARRMREEGYEEAMRVRKRKDILEVIDKNERKFEEAASRLIEGSCYLLSFDTRHYNVKKKLMQYATHKVLNDRLFGARDHYLESSGLPFCIAQHENTLYVGNQQGVISVYDMKSRYFKGDALRDKKKDFA